MIYVQWKGDNLEECKKVLEHEGLYTAYSDKDLIIPISERLSGMVGHCVKIGKYIIRENNIFSVVDRNVAEFFIKEIERLKKELAEIALEKVEEKVDKILEKLENGTYCRPIFERR